MFVSSKPNMYCDDEFREDVNSQPFVRRMIEDHIKYYPVWAGMSFPKAVGLTYMVGFDLR